MARYTPEQAARAREANLTDYMRHNGYQLEKHGNKSLHLTDNHSLVVFQDTNSWYDFGENIGGNPLDFAIKYEHKTAPVAVESLLSSAGESPPPPAHKHPTATTQKPPAPPATHEFTLPSAHSDMHRTFAYLCKTRGIDPDVVSQFAHEKSLYESADTHNVVFVGKDEQNRARYAHMKGTNSYAPFQQDMSGSDKAYGFSHAGTSPQVYAFEAPVDMLSYISTHGESGSWQKDSFVALGGTSSKALDSFLERHPDMTHVTLCLDKDKAGIAATEKIKTALDDRGYITDVHTPMVGKDWNDELKSRKGIDQPAPSGGQKAAAAQPVKQTGFSRGR